MRTDSLLETVVVSAKEVLKLLRSLYTTKASGPDNVSNTLLKRTAVSISKPLCRIINKSLATGTFATEWKEAHLSPIFKANDRQAPENYRPISLLSNIGKLLERIVFIRL